jgi:hypothetical protein
LIGFEIAHKAILSGKIYGMEGGKCGKRKIYTGTASKEL